MKAQWILSPLCLLIGIVIGKTWMAPNPNDEAAKPRDSRTRERRLEPTAPSNRSSEFISLRSEIRKSASANQPGLLKRSLTHPDILERRELILECFQAMDSTNWHEMFDQFSEVTRETGMTHHADWNMALMMVGRTGTREAAEWFRKNVGGDQLKEVVWGWSQQEPKAALGWLDEVSAESPELRGRLLSVVLGGAVQCHGLEATRMLDELPLEDRMRCVGDFGWNLLQRDGLDSVVEWAIQTKEQATGNEDGFSQQVGNYVVQKILEGSKDVWGAREAANRMARIIQADPTQERNIVMFVSRLPAGQPLEFLSGLSATQVGRNETVGTAIQNQLTQLVSSKPDIAAKWLENHPNDPMAPKVRELIQ